MFRCKYLIVLIFSLNSFQNIHRGINYLPLNMTFIIICHLPKNQKCYFDWINMLAKADLGKNETFQQSNSLSKILSSVKTVQQVPGCTKKNFFWEFLHSSSRNVFLWSREIQKERTIDLHTDMENIILCFWIKLYCMFLSLYILIFILSIISDYSKTHHVY